MIYMILFCVACVAVLLGAAIVVVSRMTRSITALCLGILMVNVGLLLTYISYSGLNDQLQRHNAELVDGCAM